LKLKEHNATTTMDHERDADVLEEEVDLISSSEDSSSSDVYSDEDDDVISVIAALRWRHTTTHAVERTGSFLGRRHIDRERELGEKAILRDYFGATPVYTDEQFETRFRMPRAMFQRILADFNASGVFAAGFDCAGRAPKRRRALRVPLDTQHRIPAPRASLTRWKW
jgi:hypothetical protein